MPKRARPIVLLFAVILVALTACSKDNEPITTGGGTGSPTSSTSGSPSGTAVAVTLQEYAVLPAITSAPAGAVTFNAKNNGPKSEHELVVVKTSLAPDKLPTSADGSVDEEGTGVESVGEIGEFPVGQTRSTTFTLSPGSYVLFCNVVKTEGSETLVHYKLGMRTAFTVT
jgi:hypothetical protein